MRTGRAYARPEALKKAVAAARSERMRGPAQNHLDATAWRASRAKRAISRAAETRQKIAFLL